MADEANPNPNPERNQGARAIHHFVSITRSNPEQATQYLEANGGDMMAAIRSYFADQDEENDDGADPSAEGYTGPRTLDGRPAPQGSGSRPGRQRTMLPSKKGRIATLGSLGGGSHQHEDDDDGSDDDYDDEEDDEGRGNLFAGGEKSGLAVQDPKQEGGSKKIIGDILAKAKANASRQDTGAPDAGPSRHTFRGTGMTLGGEGTESRSIPDPLGPPRPANVEPQERVLHIWQDGFSIDDGELRRFDDPANMADLAMIRQGRAPLHLMNVQHDAPVDVKLQQHDTPYVPQPKKYRPFGGEGRRLGSPVPGDGSSSAQAAAPQTPLAPPPSTLRESQPAPSVDDSQPSITVRVQLPTGVRLSARLNPTQTVGDLYDFVRASSSDMAARQWILATTFPNKDHTDKSLVLGEMQEFKKGGTAIVKWV